MANFHEEPDPRTCLCSAALDGRCLGNRLASARRIGLIDLPIEQVTPAGNTALLGAKLALFSMDGEDGSYAGLRKKIEHVALKSDAKFQEAFVDGLAFPQHSHVES